MGGARRESNAGAAGWRGGQRAGAAWEGAPVCCKLVFACAVCAPAPPTTTTASQPKNTTKNNTFHCYRPRVVPPTAVISSEKKSVSSVTRQ
jgi:hypothetical protein